MESAFFWDFTQRRMAVCYRRFGTTYRTHLQGSWSDTEGCRPHGTALSKRVATCKYEKIVLYWDTGRFIMFSLITNIYNKKTKGPTLMELFTTTGKLKKFFLTTRDVRCVHHGWHGTHRYDTEVLATHASTWVHRYFSLLQWSVPLSQRGHEAMVLCTKCTLHSNHRLRPTRVIFQHTKRLLPRSGHFLTTYTRIT